MTTTAPQDVADDGRPDAARTPARPARARRPLAATTSRSRRAIVDAINDDGYLIDSLDDIAATLRPEVDCDEEEVERVLMLVQTLDPAGVGARSVSECLLLQLAQLASRRRPGSRPRAASPRTISTWSPTATWRS